jgi:C-terminal processing protease CtpA/Prc
MRSIARHARWTIAFLAISTIAAAQGTPRRLPYDSDIHAVWRDGAAVIDGVRPFSDADVAGAHPGLVVVRIDGDPVARAARRRLGAPPHSPATLERGLNLALAGKDGTTMELEVIDGAAKARLVVARGGTRRGDGPAVIVRRMGDERAIGYVRIRIGADPSQVHAPFAEALDGLRDTRALILDLRDNTGPGLRPTRLAIVSALRARGPIAVLVDRWTAGEGEAIAADLQSTGATLIGTRTAGIQADGKSRASLRPSILVDLAAPSGGPGDPILYQALKLFEKK